MSYDALRRGRRSLQNHAYFITTVTRNRVPLFTQFENARLLVRELRNLHDRGEAYSLAWIIMPDHLHWLIQSGEHGVLPDVVKTLKAHTARSINRQLGRQGSVWQPGYYDHAIRGHEDMRRVARYMIANPLRAGLVERIGDYPHWDCIWMTDEDETPLAE